MILTAEQWQQVWATLNMSEGEREQASEECIMFLAGLGHSPEVVGDELQSAMMVGFVLGYRE